MKLTDNEKQDYQELRRGFKAAGGKFLRTTVEGLEATLAVRRVGKFYHVAIAVQGKNDKANKRRGKYEALCKYYGDCYIPVPVGANFLFGCIDDLDLQVAFENRNLK